ncbi:SDR family NAD(P)-dependent oxidoreductase [Nonomuraea coxensis]|nr:SDR family NAD(P)-dependent oxidoreductase [Nonomuraea coxensis]
MNRVVFLFPGQGSQWPGMGRALLEREPAFAAAVRDCEAALAPHLDWPVTAALAGEIDVDRIDVIQPALFALHVGLARLWESRGVRPAAVVGHSLGEVAAAYVAGALTLPEAAAVVTARSALYRRLSGSGAMAVVGLPWGEAAAVAGEVAAEHGGRVCAAAANAPTTTVVSGDPDAVHALVERLRWEDVFCRLVDADVAGHSHHVEPLLPELRAALEGLRPAEPRLPLWSTVTGRTGTPPDAGYWCRNLREPVLFWPVVRELLAAGHDTFVELGPQPTLLSGLRDTPARLLPSLHRDDPGVFAASLAELRAVRVAPGGVLGDHRVEGQAVFPAAGHLALALAHAETLTAVAFETPLVLDGPTSLRAEATGGELVLSADGRRLASARPAPGAAPAVEADLAGARARCGVPVDVDALYAGFAARGMDYGPAFRGVEEAFTGEGECLARLRPARGAAEPYRMDVTVLDACLQAVAPALEAPGAGGGELLLPAGIAHAAVLGDPARARWAHARTRTATPTGVAEADVDVLDEDGRAVLVLRGVRLRRIARAVPSDGWMYVPRWVPVQPAAGTPFDGVTHLVDPAHSAAEAAEALLLLAQELTARAEPPRLWVVTRHAQPVEPGDPVEPAQSAVWGLARTLRHEHPELRCALLDLDGGDPPPAWELPEENEAAYRDGRPYALRLTRRPARPAGPYRVQQPAPGDLAALRAHEPGGEVAPPPGPGQVRIRVRAAGLNFNDVLRALGMLDAGQDGPLAFGLECAGEIDAAGAGVTGLPAGRRVVALAAEIGTMATHVTVDARLVAPVPDGLGLVEAATLPAAYVTVLYGLDRLARVGPGDRVLVHAAAGGVGQAALALCRRAGAEVLATAGSERKRAWLRQQGVAHVFDSRGTDFADEVLAATGGAGVDVVVNCLTGRAVDEGLRALAPFGRFVELGKRDIAEGRALPLGPFAKSLSFHAVEAFSLGRLRPELAGELLREAVTAAAQGTLRPLPVTVHPAAEAAEAFRHMAAARHLGKIVLTFGADGVRADGFHVITGGLGGLGLAAAGHLVERGARHLALLGRSAPGPEARAAVERLRAAGAEVRVLAVDVADEPALAAALDGLRAGGRPISGIVHAAGLLRDGTLGGTDPAALREVLRPKVDGAVNLHRLTTGDPVELFVLFSSAAGLLGSAGQAGYAAANAFLDGFAHWRRAQGLPATSVDWGPWSETGLAATPDRAGRLAERGMGGIDTASGLRVLDDVLAERPAQVAAIPLDAPRWFAANPGQDRWSVFAGLRGDAHAGGPLRVSGQEELETVLTGWVAGVLRTTPAAVDPALPLTRLGLDSLMAVELRNLVESRLAVRLSTAAFLDGPTVGELAARILPHLDAGPARENATGDPLGALSDAQVDALLDELLNDHLGGVA